MQATILPGPPNEAGGKSHPITQQCIHALHPEGRSSPSTLRTLARKFGLNVLKRAAMDGINARLARNETHPPTPCMLDMPN